MGIEKKLRFCPNCQKNTFQIRNGPNHILHLILTLLTGGVWAIIWLGSCVRWGGWVCAECGQNASGDACSFIGALIKIFLLIVAAVIGIAILSAIF